MDAALLDAFRSCRDDPNTDEGRVAALVAGVLDPGLDPERVERELQELASRCSDELAPWQYLSALGFAGNSDDYGALDNSNLARVLRSRRGIPITLGVVLIRVARVSGHQATGINFPGHFIVQVDDVTVDPFALRPLDRGQLLERLPPAARRLSRETLFAPASTVIVGLRMLNNVKLIFSAQAAWDRTLDVLDAQLALAPEQAALHLERGEVWHRLGSVGKAREALERAIELTESMESAEAEPLRRAARARLDEIAGVDDILH